ncbi:MAG: VOC family protein [Candidatus Heimdallarchaeota archaeon]|nr:VOC family protein [Candidatus Heimdallarchaeota archaeon]
MPSKPTYPMTFLRTNDLAETRIFYEQILNFPVALEQSGCIIFRIGNYGYWGFCETDKEISDPGQVCLTVVVEKRKEVDEWHEYLISNNVKLYRAPQETSQYKIYNSFYFDPTGYTLEIQAFDKEGQPIGHEDFNRN